MCFYYFTRVLKRIHFDVTKLLTFGNKIHQELIEKSYSSLPDSDDCILKLSYLLQLLNIYMFWELVVLGSSSREDCIVWWRLEAASFKTTGNLNINIYFFKIKGPNLHDKIKKIRVQDKSYQFLKSFHIFESSNLSLELTSNHANKKTSNSSPGCGISEN